MVPSPFPYPPGWETTLASAEKAVSFPVILPGDQLASASNITHVFLYPGGQAIAIDFPAPAVPQEPVRQDHIEVWETAWTGGDPKANVQEEVDKAPAEGKSLTEISGVPALTVSAHSASDVDGAEPAFVRLVVSGVDVQISGGEDLDALIRIAQSIVGNSSSG